MSHEEYTSIGGGQQRFQTTRWTAIEQVRSGRNAHAKRLVGELLDAYWKPVYCYLRHRGYNNEEAKDLTQGFFHEVVLGRELIQRADRAKGRFRTLLLRALDRYLVSMHRKRTARKRIPQERIVSLEDKDLGELPETIGGLSCEDAFHYAWVSELLDRMLLDVEAECRQRGMTTHWGLFHDRILHPIVTGTAPPSLEVLCCRHRVDATTKASNMIFAVKRRFQAALKRLLRESVASEVEVREEIRDLAEFLAKGRQYSGESA
jgi:RNA polymerase sigma-70 factor (ECF subfamily)